MFIPDFWMGVIMTLFVEFVAITVMVIVSTHEKEDDK